MVSDKQLSDEVLLLQFVLIYIAFLFLTCYVLYDSS